MEHLPRELPLISIGMPCFRSGRLAIALDSLLAQTHRNWELHLYNNASPDPEVEMIALRYASMDTRIHYHCQPATVNITANFLAAFHAASAGEYYMWATDDDVWLPTFIEYCLSRLQQHPECGMAFPSARLFNRLGQTEDLPDYTRLTPPAASRSDILAHYVWEPEILWKSMLVYGLYRRAALVHVMNEIFAPDQFEKWNGDAVFNYGFLARYPVIAGGPILLHKEVLHVLWHPLPKLLCSIKVADFLGCLKLYREAAPTKEDRRQVTRVLITRLIVKVLFAVPIGVLITAIREPHIIINKLRKTHL